MSIFDKVKDEAMHQFIEVIEWLDNTGDTMVYRFPVQGQEIKNGAQLIVRESQAAVFVHEGQVADIFGPGRFTIEAAIRLSSQNSARGNTVLIHRSNPRFTLSIQSNSRT